MCMVTTVRCISQQIQMLIIWILSFLFGVKFKEKKKPAFWIKYPCKAITNAFLSVFYFVHRSFSIILYHSDYSEKLIFILVIHAKKKFFLFRKKKIIQRNHHTTRSDCNFYLLQHNQWQHNLCVHCCNAHIYIRQNQAST